MFSIWEPPSGNYYGISPDFEERIDAFKECYMALSISVTPKVHAVIYHVADFCNLTGMGLAPWNEQTSESLHHDFNMIWNNFKVKKQITLNMEGGYWKLYQCIIANIYEKGCAFTCFL